MPNQMQNYMDKDTRNRNQPSKNTETPGKQSVSLLYFKKIPKLSVGRRNCHYQPKEEMRNSFPAWDKKEGSI